MLAQTGQQPPRSANDQLGIALIGCGGRGKGVARDAATHGQIVAVCDVDEARVAEAQQIWVEHGGVLSVNGRVTEYPNEVAQREAELLSGAEHFRFDASDHMPPELNAAFWQAVLDFTADQSRLGEILETLESIRAVTYD